MSTAAQAAETPRRADAVRNREAVIKAAEEVFSEKGIEAGVPEIAERAGVGKGTVYRNFETKDDLVSAVLAARTERFAENILAAIEEDDAWEAFSDLLRKSVAGKLQSGRNILGLYPHGKGEDLVAARARTQELLGTLMGKAIEQGTMRSDVEPADVSVLFGGVCRILTDQGEEDLDVWRRQVGLVIDAFRVQPD